jgi:hypothetical protein
MGVYFISFCGWSIFHFNIPIIASESDFPHALVDAEMKP